MPRRSNYTYGILRAPCCCYSRARARASICISPRYPSVRFSVHRIRRVSRSRLSRRIAKSNLVYTDAGRYWDTSPVLTSHEATEFIGALSSRAFKRIAGRASTTTSTCLTIKATYPGDIRAVLRIGITAGQNLGYCTYCAATRNDGYAINLPHPHTLLSLSLGDIIGAVLLAFTEVGHGYFVV